MASGRVPKMRLIFTNGLKANSRIGFHNCRSLCRKVTLWVKLFLCAGTPQSYSSVMPSFDIVSQVNPMEIENAVNQARKELANRFDFKGSNAGIALEKNEIKLSAEDQFKIKALVEIVVGRLARRSISLKSVDKGEPDLSPLGHARQVIKIKQGIELAVAKQITGFIRDGRFKVTTRGGVARANAQPRAHQPARADTKAPEPRIHTDTGK